MRRWFTPVTEARPEVLEEGTVNLLERALCSSVHTHIELGDRVELFGASPTNTYVRQGESNGTVSILDWTKQI